MKKVVVIVNTPAEFQAFIQEAEKQQHPMRQKIMENRLIAEIKIDTFEVILTLSDDMGSEISETVSWVRKMFEPTIYINMGTAGIYQPEGKNVPLLDLLVPRKVFSYDRIKIRNGKTIDLGKPLCPSATLLHIAERVSKRLSTHRSDEFKSHFIHQLSGPINWSDKDSPLINVLLRRYEDLAPLGVDMESYDFLSAIEKLQQPTLQTIIIRCISDDILEEDNQSLRDINRDPAAAKASIFTMKIIEEISELTKDQKTEEVIREIHEFLIRTHAIEATSIVGIIMSLFPLFFH